jgi:hypothetical protein
MDGGAMSVNFRPKKIKKENKPTKNYGNEEAPNWIDDSEDKKKNWNLEWQNKEYSAYKGMGLPVRGVYFLPNNDIVFCNDDHLVFLDVEMEKKPVIIPASNSETCRL